MQSEPPEYDAALETFDLAVEAARRIGYRGGELSNRTYAAAMAVLLERDDAAARCRVALADGIEMRWRLPMGQIPAASVALASSGRLEAAAVGAGYILASPGDPRPPVVMLVHRLLELVETHPHREPFMLRGRSMSWDEIVEFLLAELDAVGLVD